MTDLAEAISIAADNVLLDHKIRSRPRSGGASQQGTDQWVDVWDRGGFNVKDTVDAAGTIDTFSVTIPATKNRQYTIWVYCWAYVESQHGFAVHTMASASVGCRMPYLYVEELT